MLLANGLPDGGDSGGSRNWHITRRLAQLAFSPKWEILTYAGDRSKSLSTHIRDWQAWYQESGAMFLYMKTRGDRHAPPPNDRMAMLMWLAGDSPKLQYLSGLLHRVVVGKGRRLLVYAQELAP